MYNVVNIIIIIVAFKIFKAAVVYLEELLLLLFLPLGDCVLLGAGEPLPGGLRPLGDLLPTGERDLRPTGDLDLLGERDLLLKGDLDLLPPDRERLRLLGGLRLPKGLRRRGGERIGDL